LFTNIAYLLSHFNLNNAHAFTNGDGEETRSKAHLNSDLNEFKSKSRIGIEDLRG